MVHGSPCSVRVSSGSAQFPQARTVRVSPDSSRGGCENPENSRCNGDTNGVAVELEKAQKACQRPPSMSRSTSAGNSLTGLRRAIAELPRVRVGAVVDLCQGTSSEVGCARAVGCNAERTKAIHFQTSNSCETFHGLPVLQVDS